MRLLSLTPHKVLLILMMVAGWGILLRRSVSSLQHLASSVGDSLRKKDQQRNRNRSAVPHDQETNFSGIVARSFETWPSNRPLPCFEPDKKWETSRSKAGKGFLFVKLPKCASSTGSSVALRVARNVAKRQQSADNWETCKVRFHHNEAQTMDYANRTREQSFLWSIVRDPTKRAISNIFFFKVSRGNQKPTDKYMISALRRGYGGASYLKYLSTVGYDGTKDDPVYISNRILEEYNFLFIAERFDESAVALQMLLGLSIDDVLYLKSKAHGGYDDGTHKSRCVYIQPSFVTDEVKSFLEGQAWKKQIESDLALYEAANKSLDLTIEHLGREIFETNLAKYRAALQAASDYCSARVVLPCNATGYRFTKTDCVFNDIGCGMDCLDKFWATANETNL